MRKKKRGVNILGGKQNKINKQTNKQKKHYTTKSPICDYQVLWIVPQTKTTENGDFMSAKVTNIVIVLKTFKKTHKKKVNCLWIFSIISQSY